MFILVSITMIGSDLRVLVNWTSFVRHTEVGAVSSFRAKLPDGQNISWPLATDRAMNAHSYVCLLQDPEENLPSLCRVGTGVFADAMEQLVTPLLH